MRQIQNAVNATESLVRREEQGGREYLVAPLVGLREMVLEYPEDDRKEFLPAESIAASADRWNGEDITVSHPGHGHPSPSIGEFRNSEVLNDGEKHRGEAWIDLELVRELEESPHPGLGNDARAIVEALENGDTLEVSPGYNLESYDDTSGRHNGETYDGVQGTPDPDHVAVFPPDSNFLARCSPEDGCALPRVNGVDAADIEADPSHLNARLERPRTPDYDGTTSGEWDAPSLNEYIDAFVTDAEDVDRVADLSQEAKRTIASKTLLGNPEADDADSLRAFPVVTTGNNLHEGALDAVLSRAPQAEYLSGDEVETLQNKAYSLLEDEFDREVDRSNADMLGRPATDIDDPVSTSGPATTPPHDETAADEADDGRTASDQLTSSDMSSDTQPNPHPTDDRQSFFRDLFSGLGDAFGVSSPESDPERANAEADGDTDTDGDDGGDGSDDDAQTEETDPAESGTDGADTDVNADTSADPDSDSDEDEGRGGDGDGDGDGDADTAEASADDPESETDADGGNGGADGGTDDATDADSTSTTTMDDDTKITTLVEEHGLDRESMERLRETDCLSDIYNRYENTAVEVDDDDDGDEDPEANDNEDDDSESDSDSDEESDVSEITVGSGAFDGELTIEADSPEAAAQAAAEATAERVNGQISQRVREEIEKQRKEEQRRQNAQIVEDELGVSEEALMQMDDEDFNALHQRATQSAGQAGVQAGPRTNGLRSAPSQPANMAGVQTDNERHNAQPSEDDLAKLTPGQSGAEARNNGGDS